MTDDDVVARLESYIIYDKANGGEALLRLAIHHLRNPTADAAGASWTANRLVAALYAFTSGVAPIEKAFRLHRGDIRTAAARGGNDPALRVPWRVSVVFHVDVLRGRGFKTADRRCPRAGREDVFSTVAADLNQRTPRGLRWTPKSVKKTYYDNRKTTAREVDELRRRLRFSQK